MCSVCCCAKKAATLFSVQNAQISTVVVYSGPEHGPVRASVMKQALHLFGQDFTESERQGYVPLIRSHALGALQAICAKSSAVRARGLGVLDWANEFCATF